MKRIVIASILLFASFAHAADTFLWKVTGAKGPVYILGSLHFATKELYPLNKQIEDAFKESGTLVVEVNLNELDAESAGTTILNSARMPRGETLRKHLSKEDYDFILKQFERYGVDATFHQLYKPWFLAMVLSQLELQRLGYDPELGIDKHFLDEAAAKNKNVEQLETLESQVKVLDELPMETQASYLIYTVRELEKMRTEMDEIVTAWKTGDATALEKILFEVARVNPKLQPIEEKMLDDRNRKMVTAIEGLIQSDGSDFVVVGAAHLVGKNGIVELLKAKGYQIEQL